MEKQGHGAGGGNGRPFQIDGWTVEPAGNRLQRGDEEVRLEPKAMRVLVYLAMRPGQVVSREELEAGVWTGMVVGYDAVTNSIIKLRRAFGDDPRAPRVIETLSKNGYRLMARVDWIEPHAVVPEALAPGGREADRPSWRLTWKTSVRVAGAAAAVVLLVWLAVPREPSAPSSTAEIPTIAVLPFENLSGDPGQEYFSNGITEDLITDLSKVSGLLVVARNSVFAYKESTEPEERIGAALGVRYLLKGSVRRQGELLRLNARLVDTRDGGNLWAERYDRRLTDIFDIQDELAAQIVSALEVELAPADRRRLARNHQASVEAYDELLRGLDYYARRSFDDNRLAKDHFQRAITLDPGFARAYAGLALAYSRDAVDGWGPAAQDALGRAGELAELAMRLDPSVPQVYFVRGQIALFRRDYAEALRQAEEAIAQKPGYADGHALLAWILHFAGRPGDGLEAMERAVRLNPRIPSVYRLVRGTLYYALGENGLAIEDFEAAVPMNPNYQMLRTWLAAAYARAGRLEEARWEAGEVSFLDPGVSLARIETAYPFRDPEVLGRFLEDLRRAGLE